MISSYSVICVYICVWCVPNKSIKEFRNSSWYQSQFSETLIPSGHLLFRPSLIPAKSFWPYLNPIISLSLSFRPSVPVLRAKGENVFRSVESSSENIHRRQLFRRTFPANFSGELSGDGFFLHRKERLEEISNLSQSTRTRNPSTRRPRAFFRPATASHALAREDA